MHAREYRGVAKPSMNESGARRSRMRRHLPNAADAHPKSFQVPARRDTKARREPREATRRPNAHACRMRAAAMFYVRAARRPSAQSPNTMQRERRCDCECRRETAMR
ncbi:MULTISPECIES: hypothetical protein [Lysobacter]|uniref:Uncharacterized protein n=1 Tax=Lysobacter firmicutimachus TaxID=1792846 RepID=A0ABU8D8N3_9GAMM|nr:hypothetical protein [Lysobacter antibioticus]